MRAMSRRHRPVLLVALPLLLSLTGCGLQSGSKAPQAAPSPSSPAADSSVVPPSQPPGEAPPAAAPTGSVPGQLIKDGLRVVPGTVWVDHTINDDKLSWATTLKLTGNPDTVAEAFLKQMLAMGMVKFEDRSTDTTQGNVKAHIHSVGAQWLTPDGAPKAGPDNIEQMSVDVFKSSDGHSRVEVMGGYKP